MQEKQLSLDEVTAMSVKVRQSYLILPSDLIVGPLLPFTRADDAISRLVRDAVAALEAIIGAATIPFLLTSDRVSELRFSSFFTAERIRTLKDGAYPDTARARKLAQIA